MEPRILGVQRAVRAGGNHRRQCQGIAAGEGHSLFLKTDGSLWGMGFDDYGQLGDGRPGAGQGRA